MQSDLSGNRLGKYVLQRVLGRGGMGEVYEALDPETGRTVAIKVLPASLSAQPGYLDRFNQELKLAASLEHIHILPIYDHGNENSTTYIVMRYLTGSDLANRLHKLGRPSTADARKLLRQIGEALDYAHSRGVVHRDLKPNNIMFDDRGNAYLGDFGIAKIVGTTTGLTNTGQVIGTPYYMAPEQVKAEEVDARTDIYSLGIIAFQLLTGELPFNAPTPYAVMYKHISDPPPLPTEIQANLDPRVDEIIHRALAKEPIDRYQSAFEFVQDLDAILTNIPDSEQSTGFMTVQVDTTDSALTYTPPRTPKSPAAERSTRRRLPVIWMTALLAVIAVVVFAVMMLTGDGESERAPTDTESSIAQVTNTVEPSATDTMAPTNTPTLSATDLEETIQSNMEMAIELQTSVAADELTQTATVWTATPTIDPVGTANARLTLTQEQAIGLNLTATAMLWTATPTSTSTATAPPTNLPESSTEVALDAGTDSFSAAESGVITNAEWQPVVWEFDGVKMVLVPAGCFMMGSQNGNPDEQPVHEICFDEPFWIDRYEVTQGDFNRLGGIAERLPTVDGNEHPVENISWSEAYDFCELRDGQLPTEAQWEYTARGPDGLTYPWGDDFLVDNAVYSETSGGQTGPVGSRPDGLSWVGANDMSGNVMEWTRSVYDSYPYDPNHGREIGITSDTNTYVLRGGFWQSSSYDSRTTSRFREVPDTSGSVGFRCIRAYNQSASPTVREPTPSPDAFTLAENGVAANIEWEPVVWEFDGLEMVLVPAGCFQMGSDNGQPDEKPVHEICLDEPFWIDRYEVTQGDFAQLGGTQRTPPSFEGDSRPVERISWFEARDFCQMRGGQLPTEAQWEYAARGPDNLLYPWGNEFVADNVVHEENSDGQTAPVGSRPGGISWVGAYDLSGNVLEWTSSVYNDYPFSDSSASDTSSMLVLRGGAYDDGADGLRSANRFRFLTTSLFLDSGFRCALDYGGSSQPTTSDSASASDSFTLAENGVAANIEWEPVVWEFDGLEMVLVPAGCFQMGSDNGQPDESPVHEICFDEPFWIDRYEVTQRDFARLGGTQRTPPSFEGDSRPVERISWFEARDFCQMRGGQLPTEAQWEYAARGPDNLLYPWGNEFVADNVVHEENSDGQTAPVGSRPGGISWVGAYDMSGNVLEWTSSVYDDYPFSERSASDTSSMLVLRGGAYDDGADGLRSANRFRFLTTSLFLDSGFRCVRSY